MQRKTIAAVIVNYNYKNFVGDAIDSVLAQTAPFDQIIVVNDGSTDASMDVINAYADRVQVVDKPNGGQLSACIAGMHAAATDYVFFLDADDYVSASFNETVAPALKSGPVKVQVQMIGVDGAKNLLDSVFPTYPPGYDSKKMILDNVITGFYICPPTSGNVYRKDILVGMELSRISPKEFIDGQPALAMPYHGEIISLNEPLSYYRIHGSNHSQWEKPDLKLLQGEIDWFYRRWVDTCLLLGIDRAPFGDDLPLYVLERRLMLWALGVGKGGVGLSFKYLLRLAPTHLSARRKAMMAVWAVLMLAPSREFRRYLVGAKRSPINRPAVLNHVFSKLLGRSDAPKEGGPDSGAQAAPHSK
ncbi:MAG: glycosyltransferase family A protein [Caulobacteraceae bacterium]